MKIKIKWISLVLALVLVFACFAGCGGGGEEDVQNYATSPYGREKLSFSNAKDVNGSDLYLVNSGTSNYKIVTPANPTSYELAAASDLQVFIKESTNVTLPVIKDTGLTHDKSSYYISIGNTALYNAYVSNGGVEAKASELSKSGSLIQLDGNTVFLVGAAGYGTMNAVYRFLEYQIDYEAYAVEEIYVKKATKLNVLDFGTTKITEKTDYRVLTFGNSKTGADARNVARMGALSGSNGGANIDGNLYATHVHSFRSIVPPNSCPQGWWNNGQLCLSKREVVEAVAENSKEFLSKNPSADFMMLGGEDESSACNCTDCQSRAKQYGGAGALLLMFVNDVAEILEPWLEEQNREVTFVGLNYLAYESAPAYLDSATGKYVPYDEKCIARDNVGTFLCFPNADYGHSLDDPSSSINVSEYEKLKAWSACTDNIGVYLYVCNYIDYQQYYNAISSYQGWLRTLQDYGVNLIFYHAATNLYSPFGELKEYLCAKLGADATCAPQEELTKDFFKHYYKDGATEMYEFYDFMRMHMTAISAKLGTQEVNCYDAFPAYGDKSHYPIQLLNDCLEIINSAHESVENSILDEATKAKVQLRITAEEFNIRFYRWKFHKNTMSAVEQEVERAFLNSNAKILGIYDIREFGNWVDV